MSIFYGSVFIVAIALANLSAVWFGPAVTVLNAFLFIGLDITTRDALHEMWSGRKLWFGMFILLVFGGLVSYMINADAGQIALASVVAFSVAMFVDTVVYQVMKVRGYGRRSRVNVSNSFASVADSFVFPTLAFGAFLPVVVIGQVLAKIFGGAIWYEVIRVLSKWNAQRRDAYTPADTVHSEQG